jgi:hypothetical protein
MTGLILDSQHIHDAVQICIWFLFFGFAVAVHAAHADEGTFVTGKNTLTAKNISSDIRRQLPYRFNTNLALNGQFNTLSTGTKFSSSPRLSFFTEPQEEDGWSINIQKQAPSSSKCSPLSFLKCFDSNDERPDDASTQKDSFWFVLRKAFHF